jgi:pectinesterase
MRFVTAGILLCICGICLAEPKTITVAANGGGDFKTLQEAISAAPEKTPDRTTIHIKSGVYHGPFVIPKNKPNLFLQGQDIEKTILTYDKNVYDPIPAGIDKFNPGLGVQADGFRAENLTIENTSGDHGQALALRMDGNKGVVTHCHIIAWQDTLMVNNGRDYFKDCYIAGRVDFIYGSATAVFDHCEIHSRNGGHITAASTPHDHPFGFVFLDCKLTGDATPWNPAATNPATTQKVRVTKTADLGRPWRPFASVTYIRCEMGDHIKPEGWNNWGKTSNEKTARYAEYKSTGPGAAADKRFAWTKQLSDAEAEKYTLSNILAGSDGWNPQE